VNEHHLTVPRTARYYTLGSPGGSREAWVVLHGYGQLAGRFLSHCESLDDGTRLIVAPEGLSRFYLDGNASRKVGAAWMTREDRLAEIADYVRYLDHVAADALAGLGRVPLHVLGFSQGTATAARWMAQGAATASGPRRLILWGGEVPPDLDLLSARSRWSDLDLVLVVGSGDEFITPKVLARDEARLNEAGVRYRVVHYEGGHELQAGILAALANGR
jgi:predicted esterase